MKLFLVSEGNLKMLNCPKCQIEKMIKRDIDGTEIDFCKTCKGFFFDKGELTALLKQKQGTNIDTLSFSAISYEMDNLPATCPRCKFEMVPARTKGGVKIEYCQECGSSFLDHGELATLQTWFP